MADPESLASLIPAYFRGLPPLHDELETRTSALQDATVDECMPFLNPINDPRLNPFDLNAFAVRQLEREDHIEFLHENLGQFPAGFVGLDASRPWMVYWALLALYMLGQDIGPFRSRVVKTFYPAQTERGGIGGGHGQYAHLAGTYAAILSLALVGGEEAYGLIDRDKMWHWLGQLKQADGGFQICEGGEEDVRAPYCALVAISLLNLPLTLPPDSPARNAGMTTFLDGLGDYISRCQTYEGGIADSPGSEAHGAYAFCAIACLCLCDAPHEALNKFLDMDALVWWLSSRQYAPEGGLAGRTNKLVDGCYSHWLGGCWPMVQAALDGPQGPDREAKAGPSGNLWSSEGLARYILGCCQGPDGGLRDKPSKAPDSYHTCYTLSGLSTVEHSHAYGLAMGHGPFGSAFSWKASRAQIPSEADPTTIFDTGANIKPLHPVYAIPHEAARSMREWAMLRPLPTTQE